MTSHKASMWHMVVLYREILHKLRFIHGFFKKYLVLSAFPMMKCLMCQVIDSALQSWNRRGGNPLGLDKPTNNTHPRWAPVRSLVAWAFVCFKWLIKYILGWLYIQYFNLSRKSFYWLIILIKFLILSGFCRTLIFIEVSWGFARNSDEKIK